MRKKIMLGMFIASVTSMLFALALVGVFYFSGGFPILYWLPMLILVGVFLIVWSRQHSDKIVNQITKDIAKIDFDNPDTIDVYDELTTFVRTILKQRSQIESQMLDIGEQVDTVKAIVDNMQGGFIMFNQFGGIVTANAFVMDVFGVPSVKNKSSANSIDLNLKYWEGKTAIFLTQNMTFVDKVKAALQGEGGQMILELAKTYQVSFIPSPNKGAIILIVDITEKQLAERIRHEFSANVSHELKTPLTAIAGFAELLINGIDDQQNILHFARKISGETARMLDLADNILLLSKLDEMDGPESFKLLDAADIAEDAVKALAEQAESKEVKLVLSASPCRMYGNSLLIYELFINLIDNAILYSNPGGQIKIAVSSRSRTAYISVTDDGIGIPEEELSRIFERFYRVETSRDKCGGAGLGLSIVKHIVRYHNGTINMDSDLGEGTRVYVKLPA